MLGKHSGIEDRKILEATYDYYGKQYVKDGTPSVRGFQFNIEQAAEEIPEARGAKPEQFVDLSFLEKIKAGGFIDKLYSK